MFDFKRMLKKAGKLASASGVATGAAMATTLPAVDTGDKAVVTSVITLGVFLWECFRNWRKHGR